MFSCEGRTVGDCSFDVSVKTGDFKPHTDKATLSIAGDRQVHYQRQALYRLDLFPLDFCCTRGAWTLAVVEVVAKKRGKRSEWRSKKIFDDIYVARVSRQWESERHRAD